MSALTCYCGQEFANPGAYQGHINTGCGGVTRAEVDLSHVWDVPIPGPWVADAVCATADPEAWFPKKGQNVAAVKAICASCPVVNACREFALEHPTLTGVWGGTSNVDRLRIRQGVAA